MDFLGDKRSIVCQLIAVVITAILAGCNSSNQQPAVQKIVTTAKPGLMQPFRFHKTIEVSPDNIFDVFSWGRGSNKTGAYLILESDSTGAKYTTTTGDLDGA
ncbi:hypothetical protein, partial [uncultured Mucilaginibacter sp.]|uniref:hypothetical protein n=1 Tax=uncultured Mucilaginibacter sp. TaxID=797541 RepID=UPI0026270A0A